MKGIMHWYGYIKICDSLAPFILGKGTAIYTRLLGIQ
jgi:hypothetical protein